MVKLSEIEKLTGIVGRRSVAQLLRIVRPARMNHGSATGTAIRPTIDATTTVTPPPITAVKYAVFHGCAITIVFRAGVLTAGIPAGPVATRRRALGRLPRGVDRP